MKNPFASLFKRPQIPSAIMPEFENDKMPGIDVETVISELKEQCSPEERMRRMLWPRMRRLYSNVHLRGDRLNRPHLGGIDLYTGDIELERVIINQELVFAHITGQMAVSLNDVTCHGPVKLLDFATSGGLAKVYLMDSKIEGDLVITGEVGVLYLVRLKIDGMLDLSRLKARAIACDPECAERVHLSAPTIPLVFDAGPHFGQTPDASADEGGSGPSSPSDDRPAPMKPSDVPSRRAGNAADIPVAALASR